MPSHPSRGDDNDVDEEELGAIIYRSSRTAKAIAVAETETPRPGARPDAVVPVGWAGGPVSPPRREVERPWRRGRADGERTGRGREHSQGEEERPEESAPAARTSPCSDGDGQTEHRAVTQTDGDPLSACASNGPKEKSDADVNNPDGPDRAISKSKLGLLPDDDHGLANKSERGKGRKRPEKAEMKPAEDDHEKSLEAKKEMVEAAGTKKYHGQRSRDDKVRRKEDGASERQCKNPLRPRDPLQTPDEPGMSPMTLYRRALPCPGGQGATATAAALEERRKLLQRQLEQVEKELLEVGGRERGEENAEAEIRPHVAGHGGGSAAAAVVEESASDRPPVEHQPSARASAEKNSEMLRHKPLRLARADRVDRARPSGGINGPFRGRSEHETASKLAYGESASELPGEQQLRQMHQGRSDVKLSETEGANRGKSAEAATKIAAADERRRSTLVRESPRSRYEGDSSLPKRRKPPSAGADIPGHTKSDIASKNEHAGENCREVEAAIRPRTRKRARQTNIDSFSSTRRESPPPSGANLSMEQTNSGDISEEKSEKDVIILTEDAATKVAVTASQTRSHARGGSCRIENGKSPSLRRRSPRFSAATIWCVKDTKSIVTEKQESRQPTEQGPGTGLSSHVAVSKEKAQHNPLTLQEGGVEDKLSEGGAGHRKKSDKEGTEMTAAAVAKQRLSHVSGEKRASSYKEEGCLSSSPAETGCSKGDGSDILDVQTIHTQRISSRTRRKLRLGPVNDATVEEGRHVTRMKMSSKPAKIFATTKVSKGPASGAAKKVRAINTRRGVVGTRSSTLALAAEVDGGLSEEKTTKTKVETKEAATTAVATAANQIFRRISGRKRTKTMRYEPHAMLALDAWHKYVCSVKNSKQSPSPKDGQRQVGKKQDSADEVMHEHTKMQQCERQQESSTRKLSEGAAMAMVALQMEAQQSSSRSKKRKAGKVSHDGGENARAPVGLRDPKGIDLDVAVRSRPKSPLRMVSESSEEETKEMKEALFGSDSPRSGMRTSTRSSKRMRAMVAKHVDEKADGKQTSNASVFQKRLLSACAVLGGGSLGGTKRKQEEKFSDEDAATTGVASGRSLSGASDGSMGLDSAVPREVAECPSPHHKQHDRTCSHGIFKLYGELDLSDIASQALIHSNAGTSGYAGVRLKKGRWEAMIRIGKVQKHLGTFPTAKEAATIYSKAACLLTQRMHPKGVYNELNRSGITEQTLTTNRISADEKMQIVRAAKHAKPSKQTPVLTTRSARRKTVCPAGSVHVQAFHEDENALGTGNETTATVAKRYPSRVGNGKRAKETSTLPYRGRRGEKAKESSDHKTNLEKASSKEESKWLTGSGQGKGVTKGKGMRQERKLANIEGHTTMDFVRYAKSSTSRKKTVKTECPRKMGEKVKTFPADDNLDPKAEKQGVKRDDNPLNTRELKTATTSPRQMKLSVITRSRVENREQTASPIPDAHRKCRRHRRTADAEIIKEWQILSSIRGRPRRAAHKPRVNVLRSFASGRGRRGRRQHQQEVEEEDTKHDIKSTVKERQMPRRSPRMTGTGEGSEQLPSSIVSGKKQVRAPRQDKNVPSPNSHNKKVINQKGRTGIIDHSKVTVGSRALILYKEHEFRATILKQSVRNQNRFLVHYDGHRKTNVTWIPVCMISRMLDY